MDKQHRLPDIRKVAPGSPPEVAEQVDQLYASSISAVPPEIRTVLNWIFSLLLPDWKKKYAGLLPDEMRRLNALEDKNNRLKKIVADPTLDCEMLQDVIRRKL